MQNEISAENEFDFCWEEHIWDRMFAEEKKLPGVSDHETKHRPSMGPFMNFVTCQSTKSPSDLNNGDAVRNTQKVISRRRSEVFERLIKHGLSELQHRDGRESV